MHDGLFRNCDLPKHWQKACKTLLNPAATDDERCAAIMSALKTDCKLSPGLLELPQNPDMFVSERLESLACFAQGLGVNQDESLASVRKLIQRHSEEWFAFVEKHIGRNSWFEELMDWA